VAKGLTSRQVCCRYGRTVARAVGINHVALEVGSLDEALEFYGRLFDVELRSRIPGMAFVDMGDQFLALAEGRSQPPDRARHLGLVVDDREAVLAAAREAGVQIFGGNSFVDPWGNHVQVVAYEEIQFTKAPEILRGMGLELGKTESALRELREKGLT
jgi:lactoylglutathione lyase